MEPDRPNNAEPGLGERARSGAADASREEISIGTALVPFRPAAGARFRPVHGIWAAGFVLALGLGGYGMGSVRSSTLLATRHADGNVQADATTQMLRGLQTDLARLKGSVDTLRSVPDSTKQDDSLRGLKRSVDLLKQEIEQVRTANGANLAQLSGKIDKLDRDAPTKPADGTGQKLADLAGRMDRIERQVSSQVPTGSIPPALRPAVAAPQPARQETAKQEPSKQDSAKPEPSRPEVSKQQSAKPDAAKPESAKQDLVKQDAGKQEALKQDLAKQEPVKPDTGKPEAAKPDMPKQQAAAPLPVAKPVAKSDSKSDNKPETVTLAQNDPKALPSRPATVDGWVVRDVYDGMALVEARHGDLREIVPGEFLPGAGEVRSIERRGRSWVVLTSRGVIENNTW